MTRPIKSKTQNAVEALSGLRARLEINNPSFRTASQIELRADVFLKKVKGELKYKRKALGWDQRTLAQALDYSQSAISKMEGGESDLSLKNLFRVAHTLGMHPVLTFVSSTQAVERGADTNIEQSRVSAYAIEEAQEKMLRQVSSAMSEAVIGIAQAATLETEKVLEAG